MGGQLKNRTQISTTFDNEIYKRLKEYSDDIGAPISKILDRAVTEYLDKKAPKEK